MVFLNINRDVFLIYKAVLKISGIWPLDGDKNGSAIIFLCFWTIEVLTIVIRLIDPYGKCSAYKPGETEFSITLWCVAAMMTKLHLRLNGSKMIQLIESTIEDWLSITDREERGIMIRHDKSGSFAFIIITFFLLSYDVQVALPLVFPSAFPILDSRLNCAFIDNGMWSIVTAVLSIAMLVLNDLKTCMCAVLFWSLGMHLSSQFKILKIQFQEFLLIKNKKESQRVFRRLVERHNELLDLTGDLEASFSFVVGVQVVLWQLMICSGASHLGHAIKAEEYLQSLDIFKNMLILLLTPSLYYYVGDYLTASCEEISDVFTQCNWYDLSKDSIKNFSIVILRSQRPVTLTVWKFHQLNLSNLKYTLQAVYSYVSLIVAITSE